MGAVQPRYIASDNRDGQSRLSKAPVMSRKMAIECFATLGLLPTRGGLSCHSNKSSMAFSVDLPFTKPYCRPLSEPVISFSSLVYITLSIALPKIGSRLTGLYDAASDGLLYSFLI